MKRLVVDGSEVTLTSAGLKNSPAHLVPAGSVLIVVRSGVLKHTLPVALTDRPVAVNQDMKALVPSADLDASYLARFLKARQSQILSWVRATTADNFPVSKLLDMEIALPSHDEQRRIAAILDHADALRAKRRQVLAHLDSLTQSIFHDMFGDRDGSWNLVQFGDVVIQIDSGTSPKCESRPAGPEEAGVLKLGAVTYGTFQPSENKAHLGNSLLSANEVQAGDVLMTRKNTRDLVGAVALVNNVRRGLYLPDLIFRLHLDGSRVDRHYFHALMMETAKRSEVRRLAGGSAGSMPNISKARLRTLPIELPPLVRQQVFAARVQAMTFRRAIVERALAADDELFASLQYRAFRGEL